jgi:hypothetical protein
MDKFYDARLFFYVKHFVNTYQLVFVPWSCLAHFSSFFLLFLRCVFFCLPGSRFFGGSFLRRRLAPTTTNVNTLALCLSFTKVRSHHN